MVLLNIFQHGDTTFAWDNLAILLIAVAVGYLLSRYTSKKVENIKWLRTIQESENKCKRVENEFKNYKSNLVATEKHNEKAVGELNNRVKGLEGDIRALSEEKNKTVHSADEKDGEIKRQARLINELDDRMKGQMEAKSRSDANWESKLKSVSDELAKSRVWEQKVRAAEEDAQRARAAINQAERKKLEAELRLKATMDYAGKVAPLEAELMKTKEKNEQLEKELESLKKPALDNGTANAQMELIKQNNSTLQLELDAKHSLHVSLMAELELLKSDMKKLFDEKEGVRTENHSVFNEVGDSLPAEQIH